MNLESDIRYKSKTDYLREVLIKRKEYADVIKCLTIEPELADLLYNDFVEQNDLKENTENSDLLKKINNIPAFDIREVFKKFYQFNRSIKATNIFLPQRSANSFRLDVSKLIDPTR